MAALRTARAAAISLRLGASMRIEGAVVFDEGTDAEGLAAKAQGLLDMGARQAANEHDSVLYKRVRIQGSGHVVRLEVELEASRVWAIIAEPRAWLDRLQSKEPERPVVKVTGLEEAATTDGAATTEKVPRTDESPASDKGDRRFKMTSVRLKRIVDAATMYQLQHRKWPESVQALVAAGFLQAVETTDAWGSELVWAETTGVCSHGGDRQAGTADDVCLKP